MSIAPGLGRAIARGSWVESQPSGPCGAGGSAMGGCAARGCSAGHEAVAGAEGTDAAADQDRTESGTVMALVATVDAVTSRRVACLRCHGRNRDGYLGWRGVAERFDDDYPPNEV